MFQLPNGPAVCVSQTAGPFTFYAWGFCTRGENILKLGIDTCARQCYNAKSG